MDHETGRVSGAAGSEGLDPRAEQRAQAIRAEIDETREELAETVEAIQEKLRPANVVSSAASATSEKVKDMAYNAADRAEEFWESSGASNVTDRLMARPVPLAMVIFGATWLMVGNGGGRSRRYSSNRAYSSRDYSSPDYSTRNDYPSREEYASHGDYPRSSRSFTSSSVGPMIKRSGRRVQSMLREYPLAVGAAAMIVGASLGMVVPETEAENEMMGETRDRTLQRAQDAATEAVGKVKEATADVVTRAALGD